jgi:ApbE superfamily uncharacterized protein (UPF0280 family)
VLSTVSKRTYQTFAHREAVFRICCDRVGAVTAEIIQQRSILEAYLRRDPCFGAALQPVEAADDAPEVARRMAAAARSVGVGPMATVAGAMAQLTAEAGLRAGATEAIVDNGGDIYLRVTSPVTVGLYAGPSGPADRLAFSLGPDNTPIAICSSSGKMGHSTSRGRCDLATVVARDTALADAAATHAANLVTCVADVDRALETVAAIEGIDGILIVQDQHIGFAGRLPQLVRRP